MNYELPISPNYVSNWGIKEAIREILQNAIDSDNNGYKKEISYNKYDKSLHIKNYGITLSTSTLVLGCSSKKDIDGMIGKFGEGYKLALVVLLREGYVINIINGREIWFPSFKDSEQFKTKILNIELIPNNEDGNDVEFIINNIDESLYNTLLNYFPCINDDYGEVIDTENGQILFDKRYKGKMYVEGLYIQSDDNFEYGYNFSSDIVDLDRDRKAINYYELKRLTASSVVTAEGCHPKLFKALCNSYTDIKDIEEVLDDASEKFLEEYRDMFYEKNNLEENTLVATESVMRQLEQMDINTPIVKGTEIESYLIAKANDKLGLIYEAQEYLENEDRNVSAWNYLKTSKYLELREWFQKYVKRISKEGREQFDKILKRMEPNNFDLIRDKIPDDFIWNVENVEKQKLKEN